MKTVTDNMRVVEMNAVADVMKGLTLPLILIYWNPVDLRYGEWRQQVELLSQEFADQVEVLVVEMDEKKGAWWNALHHHIPTPYTQSNLRLPTLQVIRTDDERNCVNGVRPGFIDRHNFMPGMRAMFKMAVRPEVDN
jgi:hypothetical protein